MSEDTTVETTEQTTTVETTETEEPRIPRSRLNDEAKKRKAAEKERDELLRRD